MVVGSLSPLQRRSRCFLQLKSIRPEDTGWWWWGVLALCRDIVGVFYSPSRLGQRTLVGGGGSLSPLQRRSRCFLQPKSIRPEDTGWWWWGVLAPCRDAVGVFYSTNRMDLKK